MTSLFDSDLLPRSREPLEEHAVLLRGFATAETPLLVEMARIAQAAAFRHLITPGVHDVSRDDQLRPRRLGIRPNRILLRPRGS